MLSESGYQEQEGNYDYLLKMPVDSLLKENSCKLQRQREDVIAELKEIQGKSIEDLWGADLDKLSLAYLEYKTRRSARKPKGGSKKLKPRLKFKRRAIVR